MDYRKLGNEVTSRSDAEVAAGIDTRDLLTRRLPGMGPKWDIHLPAFLTAPALARLLWLDSVYRTALNVPGCAVEFGSQWGASLNTFLLLKQIHEPWNAARRLLSFSTFEEGFQSADAQDGHAVKVGDYAVASGWQQELESLLHSHELRSPLRPGSNFEVIPGDARLTFPDYLARHPELIISHAHFDMDVYGPTRDVLRLVLPRMPRGAVLIFDELNCPSFPGETVAVEEVLGISRLNLRKSPFQPYSCYAVIE